jgi:hypothetical protein
MSVNLLRRMRLAAERRRPLRPNNSDSLRPAAGSAAATVVAPEAERPERRRRDVPSSEEVGDTASRSNVMLRKAALLPVALLSSTLLHPVGG